MPATRMHRSVVALMVRDNHRKWFTYCAGVSVAPGLVVTAHHCVDDHDGPFWVGTYADYMATHSDYGMRPTSYAKRKVDIPHDLALLEGTPALGAPPARLGPNPVVGERVWLLGHPAGLAWTLTDGLVSRGVRQDCTWSEPLCTNWTQVSSPAWYGNSGGPAFNRWGEVIGIASHGATANGVGEIVPHLLLVSHISFIRRLLSH